MTFMPESSPVPGTARGARATGMLEFRDYLHMVRRYWVMVLVLTCLGVGAGVAATVLITPRYEATTELYVSVLGEQQGTEDLVRGSDFARKSVASYVRVATSDSVLDPVIAELGLAETGRELADDVEARAPKDTSMVAITVTKDDPMLAARIADAIGASLTRVVETQLEGANPDVGQAAVGPVRLTTVQPASPPQYPVAPRPVVNLAAGLLGGLLLGIGMAVLRAMLDTRLHTADDIAEITDTPVVGEIAFDKHAKRSPLIVHTPGLNPRAESFKALRPTCVFSRRGQVAQRRDGASSSPPEALRKENRRLPRTWPFPWLRRAPAWCSSTVIFAGRVSRNTWGSRAEWGSPMCSSVRGNPGR